MSGDTIVFLMLVLFAIGNWFYRKEKGRGLLKPQISVTLLANRHRNIVINYDGVHDLKSVRFGMWCLIIFGSIGLGLGLGYSIYHIWEWL